MDVVGLRVCLIARTNEFCCLASSAHWRHLCAIPFHVALLWGSRVNLAINSHSEACLRNSSGGCIGTFPCYLQFHLSHNDSESRWFLMRFGMFTAAAKELRGAASVVPPFARACRNRSPTRAAPPARTNRVQSLPNSNMPAHVADIPLKLALGSRHSTSGA